MGKVVNFEKRVNNKARKTIRHLEKNMSSEARLIAIQTLIPLGLAAVEAELQRELQDLLGARYSRGNDVKRWGYNPGSVFLGDQKVKIEVPRARNVRTREEVQLSSYDRLQDQQMIDDMALSRVICGMSQRNYERAAQHVPETFGIKKTSTCRRFIRASSAKLKDFMERDLSGYDIVAIFIDGKFLAENEVVIALGVTIDGDKVPLGFIETSTENHKVCKDFINGLKERGLNLEREILIIIDGGKGIRKGVKEVMGNKAIIQRCQWHKRENVVSYLAKDKQAEFRKKLQTAYGQPTYEKAKARLDTVKKELRLINQSAVASLEEGIEDTLTLHRLGVFERLGESLKTTNCVENVNKRLGVYTDRVDRWQNSNQRQRWVATALLEIEPRLRKVRGYKFLNDLRMAMENYTSIGKQTESEENKRAA
jgi:transposase-like protein